MNFESELKKQGIEVITQIDTIVSNSIAINVARRIAESFPELDLNENILFERLSKLNMYKAKIPDGMAEASYFYKNNSIYFNEHIDYNDLEEFAIHECIHYLQEIKDSNNKLIRMGLEGLALNEAATQYTASFIIGVEPDFEKYYDITLYTPSPSYYPLECALLNQIIYFTGNDVLFKSTLFSTDDFKNKIVELTSLRTYQLLQNNFDKLLNAEENVIKINSRISLLADGDSKIGKLTYKLNKSKKNVDKIFFKIQNMIIQDFFDSGFDKISNLEDLENFRHKIYKFSDIIAITNSYNFFDNYYIQSMNKLEHKCNILENGGIETALATNSKNLFVNLFHKLTAFIFRKENEKAD